MFDIIAIQFYGSAMLSLCPVEVKNTWVLPHLISKCPVDYIFLKLQCECLQYLIPIFGHDKH